MTIALQCHLPVTTASGGAIVAESRDSGEADNRNGACRLSGENDWSQSLRSLGHPPLVRSRWRAVDQLEYLSLSSVRASGNAIAPPDAGEPRDLACCGAGVAALGSDAQRLSRRRISLRVLDRGAGRTYRLGSARHRLRTASWWAGDGRRIAAGARFRGEATGAVTIIGFTGYIAALGYDGLALPLGLVAGMALLAIVVAPRFVLYPVRSISGFFAVRYGGGATRRLALLITSAATVLLLAADLKAGAHALQSLTKIVEPGAVLALALAIGATWIAGNFIASRKAAGLSFALVLLGLLATLFALAFAFGGSVLPHLTLGGALQDHAKLNQSLVINRFSDVKSLTPMASPFLQLSMRNFAGLLLAVALGIVAAPHLLGRHVSQSVVAPGGPCGGPLGLSPRLRSSPSACRRLPSTAASASSRRF